MHGDIPVKHQATAAVIMIGTNDLGAECACSGGKPESILEAAEGVKSRWQCTSCLNCLDFEAHSSSVCMQANAHLMTDQVAKGHVLSTPETTKAALCCQ